MKFLLDTHILLWSAANSDFLSASARAILSDPSNELFFSAASIWETAIKSALGRDDFQVDARLLRRELFDNDYSELAITSEHAVMVSQLPPLHKDPFDRILVAQALVEGITLLTSGTVTAQYPGSIQKV